VPFLPLIPPGFLFTAIYRRLTWKARKLRESWDLVSYGILPAENSSPAHHYALKAYALEAFAWFILLLGIALNVVFIMLILLLLGAFN
jgi:hypothetical protein